MQSMDFLAVSVAQELNLNLIAKHFGIEKNLNGKKHWFFEIRI
ncbi:hypothetical protein [Desulforamulus profundi]|nr:hypothetical protein [Desulforamulus profundi]